MKKYEWLNIDFILKAINTQLAEHRFMLIKPIISDKDVCDAGTFWLVDMAGDVVIDDFDIAEFSEGYNLLKTRDDWDEIRDKNWDFELFIANTCDGLLLKVKPDFFMDNSDSMGDCM